MCFKLKKSVKTDPIGMMVDDTFKMGGTYYRISSIQMNAYEDWVIKASPLFGSPTTQILMIVPPTLQMQIYNRYPI